MPCSSWALRIRRTALVMSLGSISMLAKKRSGCSDKARWLTSGLQLVMAMATPYLSISPRVMAMASSSGSLWFGTSLNMYSAGNSISAEASSLKFAFM